MKYKKHPVLQEFDRLNNMIVEFYHEIAMKQGLSDSAYAILQALLVLGNGCTQTDIYKYTLLNKQTVNSSVKKLQYDGFLDFQPGSGRELRIYLTNKGEAIVREKILPIEQAENEVFEEMTAEEHKQILRLISGYLESFKCKIEKL
ncbi:MULTISPECIES: MarR family winged helix-turn-helix transcriptional regulator [Anaerotruncus]|jgi:DNA-binding MarR family transcriptional regulator|uniref:MarR family winged helix-turn-helix transcriptional regulator n=1 Tax=Anaerotruncus TaxID=244127 RepID=UPI00082BF5B3|nr:MULTISPECIES: MarR family transcriptional regulator [Anaerotruncus]RGX55602.1 MarR family transcriptional regulator [Anaerotruncus sp. AF02-27]